MSTRDRLLRAALEATADEAFTNLSLRRLTKQVGIVPTGFYRHFPDMDALGVELVDQTLGTLQAVIRDVRAGDPPPEQIIDASVDALFDAIDARPAHWRFIAREINGGARALRERIREGLDVFRDELTKDLAALPLVDTWDERDRTMLAELLVTLAVWAAAEVIEDPTRGDELRHRTKQQLRLVVVGVPGWTQFRGDMARARQLDGAS